ncbi:MAG TPA: TPM domain-containing protein [Candidatus Limnocylindria bacterium]|nr:TPM domain-containing protein [Candidatus Limnocylindria bacterium]
MRSLRKLSLPAALLFVLASAAAALAATPPSPGAPEAGPPFPPPVTDVVVYDYADILSSDTETSLTRSIVAIEQRVGAEIVVYTQYKPGSTEDSTLADAIALMDQWGVGRRGFDDGLAILINMNREQCLPGASGNGQVQLYAGPGYRATFLSNEQRQQIFEDDMLPLLRDCQFDAALAVGMERIDAAATPENAQALERARLLDAILGLVVAPIVFLLLVGTAASSWLRYGKDPVYLDSPSILMPAPPANLTAASGAVVWEGKATRRALTTALLDLASRGELAFTPEKKLLRERAGIQVLDEEPTDPHTIRNRRRPLSQAESYALDRVKSLANKEPGGYIEPDSLVGLAPSVKKFEERLEKHVARQGWFREPPHAAIRRWQGRGIIVLVLGFVGGIVGLEILPSGGVLLLGIALGAAGVAMIILARVMPARTMAGAMIYAMLAAYRRTLHKTMEQARSMNEVVDRAGLDWLETPDQALVWGVALGLHDQVQEVIERSVEDAQAGITDHNPWVPRWYSSSPATAGSGGFAGDRGLAPGLFSSSGVPNFGSMMAAVGTIGAASSSSSGGSGGFSGGSSGGGGGGAGGGF